MSDINGTGEAESEGFDEDRDLNEELDGSDLEQDELNQEELTLDEDEEPSGE